MPIVVSELYGMYYSLRSEARIAEQNEFIVSARAVCEPRVGPSEQQTRSSHLYL